MRVPSFNGDLSKTFGASLSNRIKTGKGQLFRQKTKGHDLKQRKINEAYDLDEYYGKPYEHWDKNGDERPAVKIDYTFSETADCDQDIRRIIPRERRRIFQKELREKKKT